MHIHVNEAQDQRNSQPESRSGDPAISPSPTQIMDILEGISDAIYTVDEHWNITYVNRKTEEIWQQRREDLLGHNAWTVFPQAVGSSAYQMYLSAMQERKAIAFEYFAPSANRWVDARIDPNGNGLIIHLSDVTERKTAEATEREQHRFAEALRDSLAALTSSLTVERVMEQILDSAATVVPSEAGCIMLFEGNSGYIAYSRGFTPEAEAFFKDYQFPTMSDSGDPVISDKQPYFIPDTHTDPTWITLPASAWIRSSIGMPIEMRGEVIGLLIVDSATPNHFKAADIEKLHAFAGYASLALENAQHVTQLEQKVAERTTELNDAKERVEAILNNSPDGILLVYSDLRIQQANAAFRRLFAYEPDEVYYGTLYDLIHTDDVPHVQMVIATVPQEKIVQQVEMRCYRKNGSLFEAELSISSITGMVTGITRFVCTLRDITERKQAQIELAEERNLLRTLIDTIPGNIYIKDINHRSRLSNIAGARSAGLTPEEIIGKDDFALFPVEMARQYHADEVQLFQSGLPMIDKEERSFGPDGNLIWVSTTKVPLHNLNGELIGLVGITRDISKRKQRDRQLQYYASLQENVSDAVITANLEFRIQSWNRAAEMIYGWRSEEVIGRRVIECLHSQYMSPGESEQYAKQVLFEHGQWQGETKQFCKDGTELYILSAVTLLKDEEGKPFGMVAINHDITERKRVAEELQAQRDFLQLVIDSVPDIVLVKDAAGHFQLVNEAAANVYGLIPAAMVGKTDAEINPYPDEVAFFRQKDQEVQASGQPVFIPEQTILGRCYQTSKIPLRNATGQLDRLLVVSFDITQYKQAEAALQQALKKEKEVGELKSRFFSMASHEFRTPLTSILLMTETLQAYRRKLTEQQIEQRLGRIQDQVNRLKEIMEDVLQLAHLQTRRADLNRTVLDLDALCRSVLDELQSQAEGTHQLSYTCDDALREVALDQKLMRQIITNLLSNAIKYSPVDKPIFIRATSADKALVFQVQDKGIGIPEADLPHLFEPFHRAANVGTIAGTGLGLTIAKEAVEQQGGILTVESQVDVGTLFTVRIPIVSHEAKSQE